MINKNQPAITKEDLTDEELACIARHIQRYVEVTFLENEADLKEQLEEQPSQQKQIPDAIRLLELRQVRINNYLEKTMNHEQRQALLNAAENLIVSFNHCSNSTNNSLFGDYNAHIFGYF